MSAISSDIDSDFTISNSSNIPQKENFHKNDSKSSQVLSKFNPIFVII